MSQGVAREGGYTERGGMMGDTPRPPSAPLLLVGEVETAVVVVVVAAEEEDVEGMQQAVCVALGTTVTTAPPTDSVTGAAKGAAGLSSKLSTLTGLVLKEGRGVAPFSPLLNLLKVEEEEEGSAAFCC